MGRDLCERLQDARCYGRHRQPTDMLLFHYRDCGREIILGAAGNDLISRA
jgi:hypothetical protein